MSRDTEVICQISQGKMIPLRFKVKEEDGICRTYAVKAYKEPKVGRRTEEGYFAVPRYVPDILDYECKIEIFGEMKVVILRYFRQELNWKVII